MRLLLWPLRSLPSSFILYLGELVSLNELTRTSKAKMSTFPRYKMD